MGLKHSKCVKHDTPDTQKEKEVDKRESFKSELPRLGSVRENITEEQNLAHLDSVKQIAKTRFVELKTIDYTDQNGVQRKWDMATRAGNSESSIHAEADAVVIIPLLKKKGSNKIETLVVEQYRPPVARVTIEFPAGLIDKNESAKDAALRELREETGFVGTECKIISGPSVSRRVCMSPGLCDETVHCVTVLVDLDKLENQGTPEKELDDGEFTVVKRLALKEGVTKVLEEGKNMPFVGLYMFAMGLEIALLHK